MGPEQAASLVFHLNAGLALAGLILLGITACWRSVGKHVADYHGKMAAECIQLAALAGSIAATFADAEKKGLWLWPAVAGGVCVFAWKFLQIAIDARVKAAEKTVKKEVEEYEKQAANNVRLAGLLSVSVDRKSTRLKKVIRARKRRPSIEHVRKALTPEPHLDDLLTTLADYLSDQLPEAERKVRNFRIGVYVGRAGVMTPVHGVGSRDPGVIPFTAFQTHPERYRLDAAEPAHVVQVTRTREMIVVEDCAAAAAKGNFFFFKADQPNYLRSMVSYFVGEVCVDAANMAPVALVVDTDVPGFFKESEQDALRYCLHEFGVRIKLELLLLTLVER